MTRNETSATEHVARYDGARASFDGPGEMRARCRAFGWTATALGDADTWGPSLRTTAETVLASAFPAVVLWGPDLVQLYNDAYIPFLGVKHPSALGQPTRVCWPEVWHLNALIYARVLAGETVLLEDAHSPVRRQGADGPVEDLALTISYSPVRGEAGGVDGVFVTLVDTTAQVAGRAALAERQRTEARLHGALLETALILDQVRDAYLVMDAEFRIVSVNQSAERILARSRDALVGRTYWEAFPASVGAEPERQYRRVAAEGVEAHFVHHYVGEGYDAHFEIDAYPAPSGGGVAVFWRDVSERVHAETALRESEARYRSLFTSIDEGFCVVEVLFEGDRPVDYRFVEANPAFVQQTGLADVVGRTMRELAPGHEAHWFEIYGRVALTGEPTRFEAPAAALGRWYDVYAFRVGAPHQRRVAIIFNDIAARRRAEVALRAREAQYRAIVEGARDYAIVTTDPDGRVESWSPGAAAVFGWTAADVVGRSVDVTFTPEDRAAGVPEAERAAAVAGGVAPDVRWHRRRDGGRVFIEGTTRALRDEQGCVRGFLKVGQDITARRRLDEALRASEARFRTLVDNVPDYAIFGLDAGGVVTTWAAGAERLKGYPTEEAIGLHLTRFYAPDDVAAGVPAQHLAEAAATGRGEWEGWRVRRDGTRFWANEIATAVRDGDGQLVGFTKISRDLTERRVAEYVAEQGQLAAARDELRRALAAAEEAERQRLARELHDQLGQELTAFRLGLDDAARLATADVPPDAPGREALLGRLAQLGALATRMTAGARYVALELRPPELDDLGFESAVQTYAAEWGARYGVAAEVAVTGALRDRSLPGEVGTALYRIVQEALTNVAKHAGASQVSVVVEKPDGEVRLIVEDDGRGFDVEAVSAHARTARRLGLAGMRERAALVGGTVSVESTPGVGTTLYVRLPVGDRGADEAPAADAAAGGVASGVAAGASADGGGA